VTCGVFVLAVLDQSGYNRKEPKDESASHGGLMDVLRNEEI
jgi:hypothetical protein